MKFIKMAIANFKVDKYKSEGTKEIATVSNTPYSTLSDKYANKVKLQDLMIQYPGLGKQTNLNTILEYYEIPDFVWDMVVHYMYGNRVKYFKLVSLYRKLVDEFNHKTQIDSILSILAYKLRINRTIDGDELVDEIKGLDTYYSPLWTKYYKIVDTIESKNEEWDLHDTSLVKDFDFEYAKDYLSPNYLCEISKEKYTSPNLIHALSRYFVSTTIVGKEIMNVDFYSRLRTYKIGYKKTNKILHDLISTQMEKFSYRANFDNFDSLNDIKGDGYFGYAPDGIECRLARIYRQELEKYK